MLGETISHYRILEKLGQGGMGEVYLAEDTRLGRKVALKFLAPELARDRESVVRFQREARAAAELSHPNIATIYDFDETDGRPFLALEYVQGQTLRDRLALGPLPIDDVIRIGKTLAAGLAEAHSHGIVHRDIKSANVMLTDKGEVKILDFGLARRSDATQLTQAGTTLGTIGYMSPEQARGETADVRSDIWSAGVVLYECLTGRLPFVGESASIIHQIKETDPQPPTALRTGVPMELEYTVLRCMEKDSALRFQHADDLRAALASVERSAVHPGTSVSAPADKTGRRRRTWGLLAGMALAIILVWLLREQSTNIAEVSDMSLAVLDLQAPPDSDVSGMIPGLMGRLQVALVATSPIRINSREYLEYICNTELGLNQGALDLGTSLDVCRRSKSSHMLCGEMGIENGQPFVAWRLIDTESGGTLKAGFEKDSVPADLANQIVSGVLVALSEITGVDVTIPSDAASNFTTNSEEAYRHFVSSQSTWNLDQTIEYLERAVAVDSTFALAQLELSRERTFDRRAGAKQAARGAWRHRNRLGFMDRLRLDAWMAFLENRFDDAARSFDELLARWPDDHVATSDFVRCLMWRWCLRDALEISERALELYPEDVGLMEGAAYALRVLGPPDAALERTRRLFRMRPPNPDSWSQMGDAFLFASRVDSAVVCYERALEQMPEHFYARLCFHKASYSNGQLSQTVAGLESMLNDPDLAPGERYQVRRLYVSALRHSGQIRRALQEVRAQEDTSGDSVYGVGSDYWTYVEAQLLLILGQPEAALNLFAEEQPVNQQPRPEPLQHREMIPGMLARIELDSLETVRRDLRAYEERTASMNCAAQARMHEVRLHLALAEGRPVDAVSAFRSHYRVANDYLVRQDWRFLGRALREAGRLEEAEQEMIRVLQQYGGYAPARLELARVYEAGNRPEEALDQYERFLEMWGDADEDLPDLLEARQRVGDLRSRQ